MKGPWRVLSVEGSLHIFHFLWPDPNENNYWLYFCILCNKNGIKGLWGDKGRPHWVQDPRWSFNGPCHGPAIHPTWPFIYWLYFCILHNKTTTTLRLFYLTTVEGPHNCEATSQLVWPSSQPIMQPHDSLGRLTIVRQSNNFEASTKL